MATPQHFDLPFRVTGGSAVAVAQDTPRDIENAAFGVLATERGSINWLPAFGRPDWAFLTGGPDPDELRDLVAAWEPRAAATVVVNDPVRGAIDRLNLVIGGTDG
jgi:hypothetical protein